MGLMFQNGKGVDIDITRAVHYFKLSARGGHLEALNTAGRNEADTVERPE